MVCYGPQLQTCRYPAEVNSGELKYADGTSYHSETDRHQKEGHHGEEYDR